MSELEPPRDPKMLLTEVSARIKIKDIKRLYELRDRVAIKWYEAGLVGLLFVASLSFLAIIIKVVPDSRPLVRDFIIGSSIFLILIVTAILEFLLRKFHALRKLYEHQSRLIEQLDKEIAALRRSVAELGKDLERTEDEANGRSATGSHDPGG